MVNNTMNASKTLENCMQKTTHTKRTEELKTEHVHTLTKKERLRDMRFKM